MDILVTSGTWYPERNGVARVATEVARRLAQRGHAVTALVPLAPGLPAEEREGSLVVRRVIERGRLPLTIKDVLETRRHARGLGRFDVALAHGSMTAVGLARARLPAPLVLAFHASHARELRFTRPRLRWGRDRLVTYLNEPITLALENAAVETLSANPGPERVQREADRHAPSQAPRQGPEQCPAGSTSTGSAQKTDGKPPESGLGSIGRSGCSLRSAERSRGWVSTDSSVPSHRSTKGTRRARRRRRWAA